MTQDQVFVPKTRSSLKLPAFDATREDITGENVSKEVMAEMWEALGDSPISAAIHGLFKCVGLHVHLGNRFPADRLALYPSSSGGRCIF